MNSLSIALCVDSRHKNDIMETYPNRRESSRVSSEGSRTGPSSNIPLIENRITEIE